MYLCSTDNELSMTVTVKPLYSGHHWDEQFCPLYRGVPNSAASGVFLVGMVLRNRAVVNEHNVATFSELSLAVC